MNLIKTAVTGVKWTTLGTIGRAVFQLLQVAILTRFLSKEDFGLVAMALFVIQFSNIFVDMGMTTAILHRQKATKKEYSSIFWLNIFISVSLYLLITLFSPFIARFYEEQELAILVPLLGLNILILAMGRQHRTILQKNFYFKRIAVTELSAYALGLVSAVLLAINNFGVYSLVYSTLLASLIANSLFLIQNLKLNPISLHFNIRETLPFLKVGGYNMGSQVIGFFSREMDILIIGKMLGPANLGVYSLAKQIVMKVYAIVNPIILNVLNPILSSIQDEKEKVKEYYLKVVYTLASVNFPVYLLIIMLSREILIILYGAEYASGYLVLVFLAWSYVTNTINNPVGSLQIATGRTDIGFKWTLLRVAITPLFIYAASFYDINTVAASIALLSIILMIPLWRMQLKVMANIQLGEYLKQFWKPYVMILAIAGAGFFFVWNVELGFGSIIDLFFKALVTSVVLWGLLRIFDQTRLKHLMKLAPLMLPKSGMQVSKEKKKSAAS